MHENKGNGCRNKLNQVRDRFKRLNIACWAICFFRVLHIIYASVLVISISLSLLFALLSSSVSVTLFSPLSFFISHSAYCHILTHPHSSYSFLFSHLYYHLHFLTIHSSSFLSSLQITVKTHTVIHTQAWIYISTDTWHAWGDIINVLIPAT